MRWWRRWVALWGLPVALSVMAMVAVRVPVAVGVKATAMVQLAPGAMVAPVQWSLVVV